MPAPKSPGDSSGAKWPESQPGASFEDPWAGTLEQAFQKYQNGQLSDVQMDQIRARNWDACCGEMEDD